MNRIRTQDDFIEKAKQIHSDYYDYSKVEYVKTSLKVKIICPVHGEFLQTPNKHLAGHGCKFCSRERMKLGVDEFIRRARLVHGDKYDYSRVKYERKDVKVEIICPEHGSFWQTPHCHYFLGQGCPICGNINGGLHRMGNKNPNTNTSRTRQKRINTCMKKYGAKTWAESDIGRQQLHDIICSDDVQQKSRKTCTERYGAPLWSQSETGRKRLSELMSSDEMKDKIKRGYVSAYGVDHYMKTEEGRNKARERLDADRRQKIREAMFQKYGVYSFFESDAFKHNLDEFHKKADRTKRSHGTFNSSKPEITLFSLLKDVFGENNVLFQYSDDVRYPFHCDFYVKPLDLFIELNAHWSHGGHFFDENNSVDVALLETWEERAVMKGSKYYRQAIHTWTVLDKQKLNVAIKNNINYLVFWKNDLSDAREWLELHGL